MGFSNFGAQSRIVRATPVDRNPVANSRIGEIERQRLVHPESRPRPRPPMARHGDLHRDRLEDPLEPMEVGGAAWDTSAGPRVESTAAMARFSNARVTPPIR